MSMEVVFNKPSLVGRIDNSEEILFRSWGLIHFLNDSEFGYEVYSKSSRTKLGPYFTIFKTKISYIQAFANLSLARCYILWWIVILSDCHTIRKALESNEITSKLMQESFMELCASWLGTKLCQCGWQRLCRRAG